MLPVEMVPAFMDWHPDLLRTHIHVCNGLASTNRKVFSGTFPGEKGKRRVIGICSTDVQIGDKVIITSGLPTAIIVRPHLDSYRVVSRVVLFEDVVQELKTRLDRSEKEKMEDILEYFTLI
jgi:hypothetical protein